MRQRHQEGSPPFNASKASLVTNSTSDNSSAFTTAQQLVNDFRLVMITTAALEPTTISPLSLISTESA